VSDLNQTKDLCTTADSQFARRMLVRAFFAFIEGLAFHLRQITLASCREMPNFSEAEIYALAEKKYVVTEQGKVRETDNYLPTAAGFLFTLRMYAKLHGAEYEPSRDSAGWADFKIAMSIRDSITHPKTAEKLEITDAALVTFLQGADWGRASFLAMYEACEEADRHYRSIQARQNEGRD